MNKKIVSFVLAMVLSVGLGVSSLFADTHFGGAVNNAYALANEGAAPTQSTTTTTGSSNGGVWIPVGSTGDLLSGNLTAEFRYYAGIMTGYEQAGGKFVISDSYTAFKALLSNANGNWTVVNYNFNQADLASMPNPEDYGIEMKDGEPVIDENGNYKFKSKEAKEKYVKAMEAWLKERGWSDEQLRVAKTKANGEVDKDADGNIQYESLSANYYVQLRTELASGLNRSASLSSGNGVSGPTVSIMEGGQTLYTYTAVNSNSATPTNYEPPVDNDGNQQAIPNGIRITSECDYFTDGPYKGLLKGTKTYGLVATGETATENGQEYEKYEWKMSYSYSTYEERTDENGGKFYIRTDFTANGLNVDSTDTQINEAVQAVIADYNNGNPKNSSDLATAGYSVRLSSVEATPITGYTANRYTNNVSLISQYNSQTQNTTYFKDGQYATIVKNSSGTSISWYHYTDNNVMVDILSLTGVGADSSAAYETTLCDEWGTVRYVLNGDYTGDAHDTGMQYGENFVNDIRNGNVVNLSSNTVVKTVYLTSRDLRDAVADGTIENFKYYFGWTDADVQNMLNFDYGDGCVAVINIKWSDQFADSTNSSGGSAVTASGADVGTTTTSTSAGTHTWHQTLGDTTSYSGWTFDSTILIGGANAYSKTQDVIVSGSRTITIESDPAVTGELFPSSEDIDNLTEEDKEAMREAGLDPDNQEDCKEYLIQKKAEELGVQRFKKDENGNDTDEETDEYKMLRNGFYYDSESGKTYAILSVSSIYLMDGSEDFHTVTGETLLVDIGTTGLEAGKTKSEEIKGSIGSDNQIMFMGTVNPDKVNGKLVLNMRSDWSNGYVTNTMDKDIDQVKSDIVTISNAIYNLNAGTISQEQFDAIMGTVNPQTVNPETGEKEGAYDWVANNSSINIANLGGNHYSWDATGLQGAWEALKKFKDDVRLDLIF